MKKKFLHGIIAFFGFATSLLAQETKRPNILFIFVNRAFGKRPKEELTIWQRFPSKRTTSPGTRPMPGSAASWRRSC